MFALKLFAATVAATIQHSTTTTTATTAAPQFQTAPREQPTDSKMTTQEKPSQGDI